ncbi:MAG: DUF4230 domain-containing protein [Bacteroidales bacterium]|nr:DUF4230 domain-containing protein [Bacteroidales bacterium]
MNKKYWIILGLSIAVLATVLLWPEKKPTEKKPPTKQEIVGMLQAQSQIATTEVTIRKMGIYDSETNIATLNPAKWKLGRRLAVIPVDVTIRYGIDLNELKDSDIEFLSGDSIRITLPKPKIIDKSYNPVTNQDEIVTLSTGLRDKVGESTIQQIKSMAFDEVVNQDKELQAQLADELTHNTETVFTSLLTAIGLHPVYGDF